MPVELFDERFTTVSASRSLREMGRKSHRQRDSIDMAAAADQANRPGIVAASDAGREACKTAAKSIGD